MSSSDFANVYASINNLQNQFDEITGNTLSNYNQLSRIVSQQGNIYNSVYYGTGNIVTGNLSVNANTLINGNLVIGSGNIVSSGNILTSNDIIGRRLFSKSSTNDVTYGVLPYSPDSTLYIQSGNNITGSSANIFFGDYLVISSDSSRKFMYTKSGNVGIGTSDPKAKLHISGNSYISGNLDVVGLTSFKSGTTGILQTILAHQALPSAAIIEHTTPFPDDATRIVININGASTTSTTAMFVRVGTVSGTYQATGYNGGVYTPSNSAEVNTDQIKLTNNHSAAANYYTIIELIKAGVSGSNDIWMYKTQTITNAAGVGGLALGSGVVTLTTGKLKYVSFNSGAGTFDAGNISILSC
jgi:hypothetical protein